MVSNHNKATFIKDGLRSEVVIYPTCIYMTFVLLLVHICYIRYFIGTTLPPFHFADIVHHGPGFYKAK